MLKAKVMNPKKENSKIVKVEEPSVAYESSKIKFKGIDRDTFDFDEEVKNGYIQRKQNLNRSEE